MGRGGKGTTRTWSLRSEARVTEGAGMLRSRSRSRSYSVGRNIRGRKGGLSEAVNRLDDVSFNSRYKGT